MTVDGLVDRAIQTPNGRRTLADMPMTVDLPPDVVRRLEAEAARRGVVVDEVIAELASGLPGDGAEAPKRSRRLSFVGIGASGDTRPFDIRRERDELASRKLADGI